MVTIYSQKGDKFPTAFNPRLVNIIYPIGRVRFHFSNKHIVIQCITERLYTYEAKCMEVTQVVCF